MNDAIGLLAISQLVCLAAVAFLYMQVQSLRRGPGKNKRALSRAINMQPPAEQQAAPAPNAAATRMAQQAYAPAQPQVAAMQAQRHLEPSKPSPSAVATGQVRFDTAAITARMQELGVDVPMLARRMRKSEAEVRALLGRQAAGR